MEEKQVEPLQERSFIAYFFLTPLTLGIYGLYTLYKIGEACNEICEDDGEHVMNFVGAFFLGLITLGIVPLVWMYKVTKRFNNHAYRYQANVKYSETTILLWVLLGLFIAVGPLIAQILFFDNYNAYVRVYGRVKPQPYDAFNADNSYQPQPQQVQPQQDQPQQAQPQPQQYRPEPVYSYNPNGGQGNNGNVSVVPPTRGAQPNISTGCIRGIAGEYQGFPFELRNNEEVVIGRDPARCSVVISDSAVSGCHVRIKYNGLNKTYRVVDMSTNGTFANGNRLEQGKPYTLSSGTTITLLGDGKNAFRFE